MPGLTMAMRVNWWCTPPELNWAGMAAIAVGIAKGASVASRKYAAERYQGGQQIEEHIRRSRCLLRGRSVNRYGGNKPPDAAGWQFNVLE